ncbi:hypothetical protein D7Z54_06395 [Salibacterium salarium]|uniref:Uncharacterized protein n=1 Tax=Salibacterium salarium TaxID=284579 RepID=A0A428N734_9BACI|nr:hypothetical protein [Salibacterium salarium]RSL34188.1 hypothetical protein D7Z54_06395 [Salibacterium salarium]
MGKIIFLIVVFGLAYSFLAWKMDDFVGPVFVIVILLLLNWTVSKMLHKFKQNDANRYEK